MPIFPKAKILNYQWFYTNLHDKCIDHLSLNVAGLQTAEITDCVRPSIQSELKDLKTIYE